MKQNQAPLYQALTLHKQKKPISFHVPGHKSGLIFPKQPLSLFQQLLSIDLTELSGLDDLHSPEGVIQEAHELLRALYQVKSSYFLVNGSTIGNLAMILATVREGESVLVQRNCHKSILHGLELAKAHAIFIEPDYNDDWQVATGVSKKSVEEAILAYPELKAVILTSPNYYGITTELSSIIELCHRNQMAVLVDEAHGAHFIAGKGLPSSATVLGADIVVQSAHKMLPAMTMGSYLHFNSQLVDEERLRKYLQVLQSSSPSYPIMASLDLARMYLATYTEADMRYTLQCIAEAKYQLDSIPAIRVLQYKDQKQMDPFKITIQSTTLLSGFELQKRLELLGIYTEMADINNVLIIFPLLKEKQFYPFKEAIAKMERELIGITPIDKKSSTIERNPRLTVLKYSYKEQAELRTEYVGLTNDVIGRVCAEMITPYPPGIPLLLPGEIIEEYHVQQLGELLTKKAKIQGGDKLDKRCIRVFMH